MLEAMFGRQLLGASQEIRIEGGAFLLVLSGTPGLMQTLEATKASFWERSQQMPISRLDEDAAEEALLRPLQASGGEADPDALALLVAEACSYPYFLQAVGSTCVAALNEQGVRRVDAGVAQRALQSFRPLREDFYERRRRELAGSGLLPAAEAAARVFGERESVHPSPSCYAQSEQAAGSSVSNGSGTSTQKPLQAPSRRSAALFGWARQRTAGGGGEHPVAPARSRGTVQQRRLGFA